MEKEHHVNAMTSSAQLHDVVSPELALVDPELARRARLRLPELGERQPKPRPAPARAAPIAEFGPRWSAPAGLHDPAPRRSPSAAFGAIGAFATAVPALLLGAVVVGMVASEVRAQLVDEPAPLVSHSAPRSNPATTTAAAQKSETPSRPTRSPRANAARPRPIPVKPGLPKLPKTSSRPSPAKAPTKAQAVVPAKKPKAPVLAPATPPRSWVPSKAEVEARTLVLLQERVALWVPPDLLDRKTNLLVNNVQAACRQVGSTPRFDCGLRVGGSRGRWLLTAVAAKNGSVKLIWRGGAPVR